MKIIRISFILLLFPFMLLECTFAHSNESSLNEIYKKLDSAELMWNRNHIKEAEQYFLEAQKLATHVQDSWISSSISKKYSQFLHQQSRYLEASDYLQKAIKDSQLVGDPSKEAMLLNNIALQFHAQGDMSQAVKLLLNALDLSYKSEQEDKKNLEDRRKYLNNLSAFFLDLKEFKKGLTYAKKSHDIAKKLQDSLGMGHSLVNMMVSEMLLNRMNDAEVHGKELLVIAKRNKSLPLQIQAYNNLAEIYRSQGKFGSALTNYTKANMLFGDNPSISKTFTLIGFSTVYLEMKDYAKANAYFEQAKGKSMAELGLPALMEFYHAGAKIKEALGDYSDALQLRKKYELLKDSIASQETQRLVHELELQHNVAQNKEELSQRDIKIMEQQLDLDRKNRWVAIHIFFLVFIGLLIIMYNMRRELGKKTKQERQERQLLEAELLAVEKERSRTAKELHDGVASLLVATKLQIEGYSKRCLPHQGMPEVMHLMDAAIQEIRGISHNLAPEMIFNEGLSYALKSYCSRMSRANQTIQCYIQGDINTLEKEVQLHIYRIIQEAVSNLVKHASASEGLVQLILHQGQLCLSIEDNGKGFTLEGRHQVGLGLKNLESRVVSLGGTLAIISKENEGTSLNIEIELNKELKIEQPRFSFFSTAYFGKFRWKEVSQV